MMKIILKRIETVLGEPSKLKSDKTWEKFPSGDDYVVRLFRSYIEGIHFMINVFRVEIKC